MQSQLSDEVRGETARKRSSLVSRFAQKKSNRTGTELKTDNSTDSKMDEEKKCGKLDAQYRVGARIGEQEKRWGGEKIRFKVDNTDLSL